MRQREISYEKFGNERRLYRWVPHPRSGDAAIVLGDVTRGDFKALYNNQLSRSNSTARQFYDQIRVSAPNGICPYCGFGNVETLDHFLPKSNYSSLSILPLNLVPSCSDCNKTKNDGPVTFTSISSHPYFEDDCVIRDQWLHASFTKSSKPIVNFFAAPPASWPKSTASRIINHFKMFRLASRYATQAIERLIVYAAWINDLVENETAGSLDSFLSRTVLHESSRGQNTWQTALARNIADDDWFRTIGYTRFL